MHAVSRLCTTRSEPLRYHFESLQPLHFFNTHPPLKTLPFSWLLLLGALTAIGPFSIDMYLPAFPTVEQDLAASPGTMEYTLASFFIGMALGQLFYGPLSDRFGRRPPLMVGLFLYSLASLACAYAGNIHWLVGMRFLEALGGCAGMVITRAVIRDHCDARDTARAFSMLIMVMGLAPILAPMFGSMVVAWMGWREIFLLLALYGAISLFAVYHGLPETHDIKHEPPLRLGRIFGNYGRLLISRSFIGFTLASGLAFAGMFSYIAGSPFVLIQLHGIPPAHFGWMFGLNALGFVVSSQINARLLRTRNITRLLHHAIWLPALAGGMLAVSSLFGWLPLPLVLAGFFVYVASLGFIGPNAMAAALATHGQQAGTASALMGSLQFGIATVMGAAVGVFHDGSARSLMLVMGFCGVGALLVHRWLVSPLHHPEA